MSNPVLVFFDRERARMAGGFSWPDEVGFFPVGWDANGNMQNPNQIESDYDVLLLDDTAPVPELKHINRDANTTLLVVVHNNSTINASPESNPLLSSWGRPYVFRKFSHVSRDPLFEKLKELITGKLAAASFSGILRNANHLESYDRLAAVCQIRMIDPSVNTNELWKEILKKLPDHFSNSLRDMNNERCLQLIKAAAAPLVL